jgi:hypothetical protein
MFSRSISVINVLHLLWSSCGQPKSHQDSKTKTFTKAESGVAIRDQNRALGQKKKQPQYFHPL